MKALGAVYLMGTDFGGLPDLARLLRVPCPCFFTYFGKNKDFPLPYAGTNLIFLKTSPEK